MGKRKTTDIFKKEVYNLVKDEYILLDEYEKSNKKVLFKHILCNSEFKMSPNRFLCGDRCPKCGKEKRRKKLLKDDKWFNEKLNEKYGSDYILRDTYKGTKGRLHIEHAVCGNIFLTFPNNIFNWKKMSFLL